MDLWKALLDRIKSDIASLRQGVQWMEFGILNTGESDNGGIIDRAEEAVLSYRRSIADLERQLLLIEREVV